LRFALESIRRQSFRNYEVIVIGDGDPEPSADIVRSIGDDRFRYIASVRNSGTQAYPNQRGTENANGRWIAYLGQDDLWMPWHLEQLFAASRVDTPSDESFLYVQAYMLGPEGLRRLSGLVTKNRDEERFGWSVPPSAWMHRADLGARIGGWREDPSALRPVDLDFLMRAIDSGATLRHGPRPSVLKFPSAWFNAYGASPIRPQADYLRLIRACPEELERKLLMDSARLSAELWHRLEHGTPSAIARRLAHAMVDHFLVRASATPGLRWLWRAHWRRQRRKGRTLRGLA